MEYLKEIPRNVAFAILLQKSFGSESRELIIEAITILKISHTDFRDNQKFLAEKRYQQRSYLRKKDYDDDWDDSPPNNGSLGGPGPSLVF